MLMISQNTVASMMFQKRRERTEYIPKYNAETTFDASKNRVYNRLQGLTKNFCGEGLS